MRPEPEPVQVPLLGIGSMCKSEVLAEGGKSTAESLQDRASGEQLFNLIRGGAVVHDMFKNL